MLHSMMKSTLGLALALGLGMGTLTYAEEDALNDNEQTVTANKPAVKDAQHPTFRVSELIGKNIVNSENEDVGEVEDIVLDTNTGEIRYVAVTYGGFLGVGDKMFAVPYAAFDITHEDDEPDTCILVLNVTQKQLEGAKGFDQDNWPSFDDKEFQRDLNERYKVKKNVKVEDGKVKLNKDKRD